MEAVVKLLFVIKHLPWGPERCFEVNPKFQIKYAMLQTLLCANSHDSYAEVSKKNAYDQPKSLE